MTRSNNPDRRPRSARAVAAAVVVASAIVPAATAMAAVASAAVPTFIDASYSSIHKYGAWDLRTATGASQGTALVTNGKKKQALTYSFQRSSVLVDYCTGPLDGKMSIYIDGKLARDINTYKPFTSCGKTFYVAHLDDSVSHKLLIQASDKKGVSGGGTQIVIDFLKLA